MSSLILYLLVFLPMAAAIIFYGFGSKLRIAKNSWMIAVTALVFVLSLCLLFVPQKNAAMNGFCSLGVTLTFGGFRTVMALVTSSIWLMSALISPEYFKGEERSERYYAFSLFVLGATMGVFLGSDLMTIFIFFEMMSLSSYVWVAHTETPFAQRASETYLYIGIIGGLAMLTGLILLFASCGTLTLEGLLSSADSIPMKTKLAAGICILVGFGAKAGMFPLHIWLPRSYPVAPTPGTVLLSGVLSKSGVFGIVAVSCWLLEGVTSWGNLLLILAVCTMFLGALLALFSTDLKRTLACSSMSQIGFILVGVAMAVLLGEENQMAVSGTVLHILNHSFIKTGLFTICAVVALNVKSLDLNDIRGFGKGKTFLMVCFLCIAASIAGIPGFSGYISKTLLHESIVEYQELLKAQGLSVVFYQAVEWIFLLSGGLTLAYMSRLFYIIFLAKKAENQLEKKEGYTTLPTRIVIAFAAAYMVVMGLTASVSMDGIAKASAGFFHSTAASGVAYFSLENLKGAAISICLGCLVFFFIGMKWMTKKENGTEKYLNRWPEKLDLENGFYRPLLKGLAFLGAIAARTVETLGAVLVLGPINLIFFRAEREWKPATDDNIGVYNEKPKQDIIQQTFSYDLILACLGVAVFLVFALVKLL